MTFRMGKRAATEMHLGSKEVYQVRQGEALVYAKHLTITQTLDGVTSDAPANVLWGESLVVTLTASEQITVTITMGGTDITSTAYDSATNTITIASVTGNVAITAAVARPYDAEVEYLQGDGTAYIDTGIKPKSSYTFDTKVTMIQSRYNCAFWGCRSSGTYSSANSQCFLNYNSTQSSPKVRLYSTATSNSSNWSSGAGMTLNTEYSYTNITCVSTMNDMTQPVTLFGLNNQGSVDASAGKCRIGGWTAYDNGVKVMELIPVRVGNIGYMYDKVSGQLFGNANSSGAFTYGNDKT